MNDDTAKLRLPTADELKHIRELWLRCGPAPISPTPNVALELKRYMDD